MYSSSHSPVIMVARGWRLSAVRIRGHENEVIKEHSPGVQTHTEAVFARLFEGVLVKQAKELQDGKVRVKLNSFEM